MENKILRESDLRNYTKDQLIETIIDLQNDVLLSREQIALLNGRYFGRKTERYAEVIENQLSLGDFNEAEAIADKTPEKDADTETITYTRKKTKGKREEDLSGLPVIIENHELTEEQLKAIFGNDEYYRLPDQVYKKLEIIPAQFNVREHHIAVYKCNRTGRIAKADHPFELFDKSIASASLVSYIMYNKYANAMPLYRLEHSIANGGVHVSRQNMAHWVIKACEVGLSLIYDRMHAEMCKKPALQADETPVMVSKDGRKAGTESRMWVYRTSSLIDGPPIILFDYERTRGSAWPEEFLKDFSGSLMCDGFSGYTALEKRKPGFRVANCHAHARRYFANIEKHLKGYAYGGTSISKEALNRYKEIYAIEDTLAVLSAEERVKRRQQEIKPLLEAYFAWAKETYPDVSPQSATGKALAYSISKEPYLKVFLEDGNMPIDNNSCEQAIRPFTIGRKNFVLIDTISGAKASDIAYSIVETAKSNRLNIYEYLNYVLSEIPKHMNGSDLSFIDGLLPWSETLPAVCRV